MNTIISILGIACLVIITVCYLVNTAKSIMDTTSMKIFTRGMQYGTEIIKNDIQSKAHWFSEDIATVHLLQNIVCGDTYTVREEWRKERDIHEDNEFCWCKPKFDTVANAWRHHHRNAFISKGPAIATTSACA